MACYKVQGALYSYSYTPQTFVTSHAEAGDFRRACVKCSTAAFSVPVLVVFAVLCLRVFGCSDDEKPGKQTDLLFAMTFTQL
jgi:hypothetical protein